MREVWSGTFFAADLIDVELPDLDNLERHRLGPHIRFDRLRLILELVYHRVEALPLVHVAVHQFDLSSYHQRAVMMFTLLLDVTEVPVQY